ncbi:Activating signal cointegrator 1 complex subunit 2 [Aphelenchoides avenae]|nr:Activating signal cointegrator 1 complex subunit 2 [Aphelenchus avenae]
MDSIKKENAYDVPDMELPRLKRNLQNAPEWMSQANSISAFFGMLLNSPQDAFWSTVVYSTATLKALDSFLDSFPRPYCKQDMALYLDANTDVRRMSLRLYQQVLVFLLRIIANTDKLDQKSFSLYTSFHKVITADRLVKMGAIYASNNKAALMAVISNIFKTLPGLANELNEFAKNANQRLRRIEAGILDLVTAAENDRAARSVSRSTTMDELLDSGRELCLSVDAFHSVHELNELGSWSSVMNALPAFVDTVSTALSDLALMNFAVVFSAGHFKTFLKKRSLLLQAAVHLFKRFYTCGILSDRDRFQLIYGNMEHKA